MHRRHTHSVCVGLLTWWLGMMLAANTLGGELQTDNTNSVVAGYLHRFPAYVKWPGEPSATNSPAKIWRVGLLGSDANDRVYEQVLVGPEKAVAGRTFEISRADQITDLPRCDMILITLKNERDIKNALAALADQPVLTVSTAPNFVEMGGMIGLEKQGDNFKPAINLDRIRAAHLEISSRMLGVAIKKIENGVITKNKK